MQFPTVHTQNLVPILGATFIVIIVSYSNCFGNEDISAQQMQNDILVEKLIAHDKACDGTADTNFSASPVDVSSGQCVVWKITLTNIGEEPSCNNIITDFIPYNISKLHTEAFFFDTSGTCESTPYHITCSHNTAGNHPACIDTRHSIEIRYSIMVL